ncbi:IMP cyclohydrolase [Massiliimalia massiliensis]|uniref:IMP cyclohydrolase n=1 Tax=Massiliimalia massiliensis TaxID=1852384 RepID=UPI0009868926|nr:IMP cyclohydrolase [Massiliimalia massiliensis]MBS1473603.1 inosine monophosphate cyclohydrolase [Massiliimalia sp.]
MNFVNIKSELEGNTYPGRGIILGMTPDGAKAAIAYFIMGRSENSRNRVFVEDGAGIRTQAFDPAKLSDPSLIIYSPVRVLDEHTVVTNGDQTDTVYDFMANGRTFEEALRTRTFEPDSPNYTPRISGIVTLSEEAFSYKLSILKSNNGNSDSVQRFFYEYAQPVAGEGHFIHTYACDGNPIPSYEGDPQGVVIEENDLDAFTKTVWEGLNADNKVSLFTRFIDLKTGKTESRIMNKNK